MKRTVLFVILCGFAFSVFSIVPGYYGARSLSLGYGSSGFNYDLNAMFLNPALLTSIQYSLSGYQYQNSYMDYKSFEDNLSSALAYNIANFESLNFDGKQDAFNLLKEVFQSPVGMYGFVSNVPGFVSRGYALSVSWVNTAIVNPIYGSVGDGTEIFSKDIEDITNTDIAALKMNFLGLKYKQISLGYGMDISRGVSIGVTLHYLNGKLNDFDRSITDSIFSTDNSVSDYLKTGWSDAEENFSKIVADGGVSIVMGSYFRAGVMYQNFAGAKINTPTRELELPKRIVAGLAFRPDSQWGFYLDMDVIKTDLYYNGEKVQPISLGIEKGFFNNKLFVRAGMRNDITEKHFFGKKSNALYGMGLGFNMGKLVVDVAVGIDNDGSIKNLAVSGFIVVR